MSTTPTLAIPNLSLSRDAAQRLIEAAIAAARAAGIEISVAVVDAGGITQAFSRTDRAPFLTVDAAINKAWTAAAFGLPTKAWNAYLADPKLAPIAHTPRLIAIAGGVPILVEGHRVGGLGVSGGSYDQDQAYAEAAISALGLKLSA